MCSSPPSSPTIVGSAVATIVPSSAASSITSTRPVNTTPTRTDWGGASCALTPVNLPLTQLGHRREQALGVGRVVVVKEAGTHGAVRCQVEMALQLPGVVV